MTFKERRELRRQKRLNRVKNVKRRLTLRGVLSFFVILVIIRQFFMGHYENVFMGFLTLFLFAIPVILDKRLKIDLPPLLEITILCFIFAAEILGEINSFYTRIPHWDTMLHTINGFIMAGFGFGMVDIVNRSERFSIKLTPIF